MKRTSTPNLDRITRDPQMMGGKPCLRGMRVTVGTIVGLVAAGYSNAQILAGGDDIEVHVVATLTPNDLVTGWR